MEVDFCVAGSEEFQDELVIKGRKVNDFKNNYIFQVNYCIW